MYFMGTIGNGIKATRSVFHSCLRISWAHRGCFHALEHCPKTSWARCLPVTVWNSLCWSSLLFYLQRLILKAQPEGSSYIKVAVTIKDGSILPEYYGGTALFLDWFFVVAESWEYLFLLMANKCKKTQKIRGTCWNGAMGPNVELVCP